MEPFVIPHPEFVELGLMSFFCILAVNAWGAGFPSLARAVLGFLAFLWGAIFLLDGNLIFMRDNTGLGFTTIFVACFVMTVGSLIAWEAAPEASLWLKD
jgi:hypothetical protein